MRYEIKKKKKCIKTKTETPRFQHVFMGYKLYVQRVHSYINYRHRSTTVKATAEGLVN